jgi:hypothetical protein
MSQSISFSYAKSQFLEDTLNLKRVVEHSKLTDLLSTKSENIPVEINRDLEQLAKKSLQDIEYWTEQELVIKHISPIVNLVEYRGIDTNSFANRNFGYDFGEIRLSGAMDFLVAGGRSEPKAPYFCLHEYKKEQNFDGDPKGQLLAEMLVAQALNRDAKTGFETIYGCYIVGRNWFWVILKDKEYAVSRAYDSTRIGDLSEIYLILVKIKYIIEDHIARQKLILSK